MLPNLEEEKIKLNQGYDIIIGLDEVGRGPLAGPVVSCACYLDFSHNEIEADLLALGIKDSKKITQKKREKIYDFLKEYKYIKYAIGIVDEKTIDKINVLEASLLSMKIAFEKLNIKNIEKTTLLLDGREILKDVSVSQKAIIKGDAKSLSIATASVIAKVTRDKIMQEYAKKYPKYQFEKHKGYGTKLHFEMIKKHGPCKIHRKSFLH